MIHNKLLFIQACITIFLSMGAVLCSLCIHDINKRIADLEVRVEKLEKVMM